MAIGQDTTTTVSTSTNDYVRALLNNGVRWDIGRLSGVIRVYVDGSDYTGIQLAQIYQSIFLYENYANIDLQNAASINPGNPASVAEI